MRDAAAIELALEAAFAGSVSQFVRLLLHTQLLVTLSSLSHLDRILGLAKLLLLRKLLVRVALARARAAPESGTAVCFSLELTDHAAAFCSVQLICRLADGILILDLAQIKAALLQFRRIFFLAETIYPCVLQFLLQIQCFHALSEH